MTKHTQVSQKAEDQLPAGGTSYATMLIGGSCLLLQAKQLLLPAGTPHNFIVAARSKLLHHSLTRMLTWHPLRAHSVNVMKANASGDGSSASLEPGDAMPEQRPTMSATALFTADNSVLMEPVMSKMMSTRSEGVGPAPASTMGTSAAMVSCLLLLEWLSTVVVVPRLEGAQVANNLKV
jgi:hypothetical protein